MYIQMQQVTCGMFKLCIIYAQFCCRLVMLLISFTAKFCSHPMIIAPIQCLLLLGGCSFFLLFYKLLLFYAILVAYIIVALLIMIYCCSSNHDVL